MRNILVAFLLTSCYLPSFAQDSSLLQALKDADKPTTEFVTATFKATHIVNTQTIESPAQGDLNFVIMHRFGKINDGSYAFFGLDNATLRLGFDYGITSRLSVGIGRSSLEKTFDGYLKYKLIRQTVSGSIPVTIDLLGAASNYTLKFEDKPYLDAKYRTAYTLQVLIARKFTRRLSLQLAPTYQHFNLVPTTSDNNDVFAATLGARFKITRRMSITGEYNYFPSGQMPSMDLKNSMSFGWDIETGGHVFQLVFSNSQGMTESQFIPRTTGSWGHGDIYFGFNVSRNFTLKKK